MDKESAITPDKGIASGIGKASITRRRWRYIALLFGFLPVAYLGSSIWQAQRQDRVSLQMFEAIRHENSAAVLQCLNQGADVNAREATDSWMLWLNDVLLRRFYGTSNQRTVLMEAVAYSNRQSVEILLEHGADIHAKAGDNTALTLARQYHPHRGKEIVRLLERFGKADGASAIGKR